MKVLIEVDNHDCRIGAVNDALDLCRYGRSEGIEFVMTGPIGDELMQNARQIGFQVLHKRSVPFARSRIVPYAVDVFRWSRLLRKIRPDVVHLNFVSWGPSLACAANFMGIPVVARAGGAYHEKNPSRGWVARYLANCEAQAVKLLESPLRDRVTVVGDLINLDRFSDPCIGAPMPTGGEQLPRVLFLGQLVERKGLEPLVKSFHLMRSRAELYLVGGDWGEAGYPARIRGMVENLGLQKRVHLLNHRTDAINLMRQCDVFVLPSFSEARPRSIIEAMMLGRCVVSTRTGGIPTLIKDGVTGLLVEPGDVEALARALDRVVSNEAHRSALGASAKKYAEAAFNPETTCRNYLKVCRAVCGGTTDAS